MQNNPQHLLAKNINQYNIETIFTQLYNYKCFEANLRKALLMEDYSKLGSVYLINAYWFNQWKKITCYEAIKEELSPYFPLQQNYKSVLNNYLKVVSNICMDEKLEIEIDNNYILGDFDNEMNRLAIDEETEFEVISKDLWDSFVPPNTNNINQGTAVEFKLERLTSDSLLINISSLACYIIFWQRHKQKLGKIILVFKSNDEKVSVLNDIKFHLENFATYYACNLEDLHDDKIINFNHFTYTCINKSEMTLSYTEYKNSKNPMGLDNVRMTCYMNAALQSLYNTPKLTNYFISNRNIIEQSSWIFSSAYLEIVLNLSKKAKGSKKKSSFSPKKFFNIISNEREFQGFAGDSTDLIRFFFETVHKQLNHLNPKENNIFKKYYFNPNNNDMNFCVQRQIQNLNNFIDDYTLKNNSIICNTFYYIEKTEYHCGSCKYITSTFGCQPILVFPLENVRKKVYNINNNINNNNQMFNCNQMPNNCGMMNNNNFMMNNNNVIINNYMNMNVMNMNNQMINNGIPMNNNMLMMMNNNNNNFNYDKTPITLEQCFEYYVTNANVLNGFNCEGCKTNLFVNEVNKLYSLPDVLIINLHRDKGNKYPVKISYPQEIDLHRYVETNIDNNYYYLRCIITHLGESGTGGHYIAFCFLENRQKWFKFNDSIVTESDFNTASTFGDSYVLFYKRKENGINQINQ